MGLNTASSLNVAADHICDDDARVAVSAPPSTQPTAELTQADLQIIQIQIACHILCIHLRWYTAAGYERAHSLFQAIAGGPRLQQRIAKQSQEAKRCNFSIRARGGL